MENEKTERKKYPSQEKYEAEHPFIGARVDLELDEKINETVKKTGKSKSQIFRETWLNADKLISDTYNKASMIEYKRGLNDGETIGEKKGYNKALKEYGITIFCKFCGAICYITPNSKFHKNLIEYADTIDWTHDGRPRKFSEDAY